jgi:hypothetical protein
MARRLPVPESLRFENIARWAQFRDRIAIPVVAPPEAMFRALEEVVLPDMKVAWLLGEIRYLPARMVGRNPPGDASEAFLSVLKKSGTLVLEDDRPREIITGSAGQLHRVIDQAPVLFKNREAFDAFADANHEKLFMSLRVAPTGFPGESWLVLEHATRALSTDAERRFRRYWRIIKPMGAFVSRELLRAVRTKAQHLTVEGPQRRTA